ncbi:MAG: four helix bundle protein [Gemmataceae bacterium]
MQDFRKLKVWEKSHSFVLDIYTATEAFPRTELYGLTSQLRRSAMSVPMNIAEGCGRGSDADFGRFLQMSLGSACEADYQILLSSDLKFLNAAAYDRLQRSIQEVKRMLSGLLQKVKG